MLTALLQPVLVPWQNATDWGLKQQPLFLRDRDAGKSKNKVSAHLESVRALSLVYRWLFAHCHLTEGEQREKTILCLF